MVLSIMLYKVVLTFESVNEILKCDHSNQSFSALLFCDICFRKNWSLDFISNNFTRNLL